MHSNTVLLAHRADRVDSDQAQVQHAPCCQASDETMGRETSRTKALDALSQRAAVRMLVGLVLVPKLPRTLICHRALDSHRFFGQLKARGIFFARPGDVFWMFLYLFFFS